ncbi:CLUMA_CG020990, isoform A [Clunio marinus]|uniref:Trehalase n=1 Tax=Clunio marinus TaxID=568069 RepID=A0A1J1J8M2_9DIPT|nr:CLUMA_CG020990, isoform A [Clunio marinus]
MLMLFSLLLITSSAFINGLTNEIDELPKPCPSEIYCHGRLLETVQMARIFNDSKTFVDMKLKESPSLTLKKFDEFMAKFIDRVPDQNEIQLWVKENFEPAGSEFEDWVPEDYSKSPEILNKINDKSLRSFAEDLNKIWLDLGRKMKKEVADNQALYSIIYVQNPVIVPGGRFREFYYWDSYWIIRGLLLSEMVNTAQGMIRNFLSIIERFGFIPNGGRIYYSMRSQPPLLAPMIKTYFDHTKDYQLAIASVDILAREFEYWMQNHTVLVKGHRMAKYGDKSSGPRPESFREDIETGKDFPNDTEREAHYSELKAAAESGMDFSSRWFIDKNGTNNGDLRDLKTRSIIPVELNAILFWNAKIISEFYGYANLSDKQEEYYQMSEKFYKAVEEVLWNEEAGVWLDYDLINEKSRNYFVATNLSPLWMRCYNPSKRQYISDRVVNYINENNLDSFPGGVPTTMNNSGEQWDKPNVWAPFQHMLIVGLDNLEDDRTKKIAQEWAQRWVLSNYIAYKDTGAMYEKYLANELGGHGGGGEYEVQKGFGWTNGVLFDLFDRYGAVLSSSGVNLDQNF